MAQIAAALYWGHHAQQSLAPFAMNLSPQGCLQALRKDCGPSAFIFAKIVSPKLGLFASRSCFVCQPPQLAEQPRRGAVFVLRNRSGPALHILFSAGQGC
jgi:hypothetical protein